MATPKTYFFTKKARSERHTSPTGDKFFVPKKWTVKDGEYVWINDTPVNLFEQIQAERDAVDLQAIIRRYESGDKDALDRVNTMYIDTIGMPKNYAEMFEQVDNMKNIFAQMPLDLKTKFNNNPATFWKKAGSPEFDSILNDWRSQFLSKTATLDEDPVKVAPLVKESEVKE